MSLSETPARFNSDAIGTSRLRRMAMPCRAANPDALGKTIRLVSPVTFNAPSARAARLRGRLAAIEGATTKACGNRKGHAPTTQSLVIDLLDSLTKLRERQASNHACRAAGEQSTILEACARA